MAAKHRQETDTDTLINVALKTAMPANTASQIMNKMEDICRGVYNRMPGYSYALPLMQR